jgi:DNA polymerase III epsilon subunit-like protein
MKQLIFIDFETMFSTSDKYDLRSLDIVSYVRDSRFKVFGLGASMRRSEFSDFWFSGEEIWPFINSVDWKNTTVIGHNIKFDAFILKQKYGILAGQYIDTLALSRAVYGKTLKSHALGSLAEVLGLEAKGHLDTNGKTSLTNVEEQALATYCLHDVALCRQIFEKLSPEFPENQYGIMDQTVRMFVDPKLQLNVPLLEIAAKEEALRRENIFKEIGIDKKEFASNVKFPKLLESRGYTVPTKESPRKKDAAGNPLYIPALALGDTEFLEMLEGENEELKALCEARVAAKSTLLETRSNKMAKIGRTGLWPFDVEFSGADQTHRFSGGKGAGGNPQNFTRGSALREAVEAPEGFELCVGDFSNIELRIQAYLSKDRGMIDAIESGKDIYCDFASAFYGRTITKEDKQERRFGKTAILGLGYGMGWKKFIKTVRVQTGQTIDEEASRKAVDLYRTRYAQIPALWQMLDNAIPYFTKEKKYQRVAFLNVPVVLTEEALILPSGLKIRFPNLRQEEGERGNMEWVYDVWVKGHLEKRKLYGGKVLENICQGLAGELCKESMVRMGEMVVGQIHDELLVLCKKGLEGITIAKLKRAMTISPSWLPQMKLDAEVHSGANWLEAK